jgi:type II secretory pathway pseudopilin PulG
MIFPSRFNSPRIDESGFGFIGMVFIVLLLAVSAITIALSVGSTLGAAQNRATDRRAKVLDWAIARYRTNHGGTAGTRPATLDALVVDESLPCAIDNDATHPSTYLTLQGWCGPYVDRYLTNAPQEFKTDGWGTAFLYAAGTGVLTSCGPDRNCGNGDDVVITP